MGCLPVELGENLFVPNVLRIAEDRIRLVPLAGDLRTGVLVEAGFLQIRIPLYPQRANERGVADTRIWVDFLVLLPRPREEVAKLCRNTGAYGARLEAIRR